MHYASAASLQAMGGRCVCPEFSKVGPENESRGEPFKGAELIKVGGSTRRVHDCHCMDKSDTTCGLATRRVSTWNSRKPSVSAATNEALMAILEGAQQGGELPGVERSAPK